MAKNQAPKQTTRHVLAKQVMVGVLSFVVLLETLALLGGLGVLGAPGSNLASVISGVVAMLTNEARTDEHLGTLTENELLARGAQMKAEDMAEKGYFAHVGPDGSAPWKWFTEAGYQYQYAGENLAVNFTESENVVAAWMNSPAHRANILRQEFTEIGIGIATGTHKGKKAVYVVQFFGKPAAGVLAPTPDARVALATAAEAPLTTRDVLGTTTESVVAKFADAPESNAKGTLFSLAGILASVLLAGVVFGKRLPVLWPSISVLLVLVILLGFVLLQQDVLFGL